MIAYLRTPAAIRQQCDRLFTLACHDQLHYFGCDLSKLEKVANYVVEVMSDQYPDLNVPFHSRWRHFEVGGIPRLEELEQKLSGLTPIEKAQTKFDLVIISVLLDAGAGADWQYLETETGLHFCRSEGLAVASFRMFCQGLFSSNPNCPLQADAKGLQRLTLHRLAKGFQISPTNRLLGLEGRQSLLKRLGQSLQNLPHLFGETNPRPGNLVDYLLDRSNPTQPATDEGKNWMPNFVPPTFPLNNRKFSHEGVAGWGMRSRAALQGACQTTNQLAASTVFTAVLEGLADIWPGRLKIAHVNLGDVWLHSALGGDDPSRQYVPFHKLSQWLTYSLLEPLQEMGLEITELDQLTGLPEYRNGGLCLDLGLLKVKEPAILQKPHSPESEVIVEWRSLTVSLLDRIATVIRQQLNLTAAQLPLVKVLQGGTWTAGRKIAAQLREGGVPPIPIKSDGTVF